MLKGLGRRFLRFVKDVWSFLRGEWFDLADSVWGFVRRDLVDTVSDDLGPAALQFLDKANPLREGSRALQAGIGQITQNPDEALAALLPLTLVSVGASGPFAGLSMASIVGPALALAGEFALADERAARDRRLTIEGMPEMTRAQWEAQKPLVPEQQETQIRASLPFIPLQTEAQINASLPFIPLQTEAQWEAQKPLVPDQQRTQWEAQKPLVPEQAEVQAAASLAAQIAVRPGGIPTSAVANALFRGIISRERFNELMARQGIPDDQLDEYIEALKFFPTPSDLVTWTGREVFEPDSIQRYGLDAEFESLDLELFAKVGVSEEIARNYWIAHWDHPSFTQVANMLHRDVMWVVPDGRSLEPLSPAWYQARAEQEAELQNWLRLVEIPPYARPGLIAQTYNPLSRVDVRRMWGMGALDDAGVLRAALDIGYTPEGAQAYLLFVKISNIVPDLIAQMKNGWIGKDEIVAELMAAGLSRDVAERIYRTKVKAEAVGPDLHESRQLTKTEIYKAINKGFLDVEEGRDLLLDMGYEPDVAEILLRSNVAALAGSPDSFGELKALTQQWRRAAGLPAAAVPDDIVQLGRERSALLKRIQELKDQGAREAEVAEAEAELRRIEERYRLRLIDTGLKPPPPED